MSVEVVLPELGEKIEAGNVVNVLVAVGDRIAKDASILEVETDKATLEVPAPVAGVVREVRVKAGDEALVGQVLIVLDEEGAAAQAAAPAPAQPASAAPVTRPAAAAPPSVPAAAAPVSVPPPSVSATPVAEPSGERKSVPAAPNVRRLAYEIGVHVSEVQGSGPGGRISADDVKRHSRELHASGGAAPGGIAEKALPDFAKWGAVESVPMTTIRRLTAENMAHNWAVVAPVTQFDKFDITDAEDFRGRYKAGVEAAGGKLTLTAILVKVVAAALKRYPQFNASLDMRNRNL